MDPQKKKEIAIFLSILVILTVSFVVGIFYLKMEGGTSNSNTSIITPSNDVSTTSDLAAIVQSDTLAIAINESSTPRIVENGTTTKKQTSITTSTIEISQAISPPVLPEPIISSSATTAKTSIAIGLPYSIGTFGNEFNDNDGWSQWWGNITQDNGTLTIAANATGTGGGDLLVGGDDWTNYTFQTILDWYSGQTFGLIAHNMDDQNYLECQFSEQSIGTVQINFEQFINGKETILATGNIQNYNQTGGADISVAIQVNGNQGSCGFNYNSISTYVAGNAIQPPLKGGIGFVTWDPNINNSKIVIKSIGVSTSSYYLGPNTIQGN